MDDPTEGPSESEIISISFDGNKKMSSKKGKKKQFGPDDVLLSSDQQESSSLIDEDDRAYELSSFIQQSTDPTVKLNLNTKIGNNKKKSFKQYWTSSPSLMNGIEFLTDVPYCEEDESDPEAYMSPSTSDDDDLDEPAPRNDGLKYADDLDEDDALSHKTFKERAIELMKKTQGEHSHKVSRTLNPEDWLYIHRIIRKSKGLKSKYMMRNLAPYLFDPSHVVSWECNKCQKMISGPVRNYVDHLASAHALKKDEDPLFPCDVCGDYIKKDKYVVHWVPHFMEHTCPICKKTFALNCHMKYHYKVVHEQGEQTCLQCGKLVKNDLAMRRHLRLFHSNRNNWKVCDICGKCVKSRCLEPHKLTHSQDRPFKCDVCKKCFKTPSTLYQHQKVHATDSKAHKYLCEYCGKRFKHHTSWNLHVVRIHEGEYEHECPVCKKRFHKLFELKKHSVKHSEERPYPCDVCGKHFKTKTHLREHVTIHSEEKSHICPLCGKGIRMKANLYKHLKVHRNRGEYVPPLNGNSGNGPDVNANSSPVNTNIASVPGCSVTSVSTGTPNLGQHAISGIPLLTTLEPGDTSTSTIITPTFSLDNYEVLLSDVTPEIQVQIQDPNFTQEYYEYSEDSVTDMGQTEATLELADDNSIPIPISLNLQSPMDTVALKLVTSSDGHTIIIPQQQPQSQTLPISISANTLLSLLTAAQNPSEIQHNRVTAPTAAAATVPQLTILVNHNHSYQPNPSVSSNTTTTANNPSILNLLCSPQQQNFSNAISMSSPLCHFLNGTTSTDDSTLYEALSSSSTAILTHDNNNIFTQPVPTMSNSSSTSSGRHNSAFQIQNSNNTAVPLQLSFSPSVNIAYHSGNS